MNKRAYYMVNTITWYRLIAALLILLLLWYQQYVWFRWMLVISFLTDAVDGYLARKFGVISKYGSTLDSIADDLTIAVAVIGILVFKPDFIPDQIVIVAILLFLYLLQIVIALIRYGKISSFHTYLAKIASVLQGAFLLLFFFLPEPVYTLFYLMAIFTILDLAEEIILVLILPQWNANVKGLYWAIKWKSLME